MDASVAVKWVVDEQGHDAARALLRQDHELIAPDFLLIETANVLWKKVRRKELTTEQASIAAEAVMWPLSHVPSTAAFSTQALSIALQLDHPAYDCLYLAAAQALDGIVVTADQRFLLLIARSEFKDRAIALDKVIQ